MSRILGSPFHEAEGVPDWVDIAKEAVHKYWAASCLELHLDIEMARDADIAYTRPRPDCYWLGLDLLRFEMNGSVLPGNGRSEHELAADRDRIDIAHGSEIADAFLRFNTLGQDLNYLAGPLDPRWIRSSVLGVTSHTFDGCLPVVALGQRGKGRAECWPQVSSDLDLPHDPRDAVYRMPALAVSFTEPAAGATTAAILAFGFASDLYFFADEAGRVLDETGAFIWMNLRLQEFIGRFPLMWYNVAVEAEFVYRAWAIDAGGSACELGPFAVQVSLPARSLFPRPELTTSRRLLDGPVFARAGDRAPGYTVNRKNVYGGFIYKKPPRTGTYRADASESESCSLTPSPLELYLGAAADADRIREDLHKLLGALDDLEEWDKATPPVARWPLDPDGLRASLRQVFTFHVEDQMNALRSEIEGLDQTVKNVQRNWIEAAIQEMGAGIPENRLVDYEANINSILNRLARVTIVLDALWVDYEWILQTAALHEAMGERYIGFRVKGGPATEFSKDVLRIVRSLERWVAVYVALAVGGRDGSGRPAIRIERDQTIESDPLPDVPSFVDNWRSLLENGLPPAAKEAIKEEELHQKVLAVVEIVLTLVFVYRAARAAGRGARGFVPGKRSPPRDLLRRVDDVLDNPNLLEGGLTPEEFLSRIGGRAPDGWKIERLGKGSHAGQGWVLREYTPRGDPTGRQIRWHPGGGHHGTEPYWKVVNYNTKSGEIR